MQIPYNELLKTQARKNAVVSSVLCTEVVSILMGVLAGGIL